VGVKRIWGEILGQMEIVKYSVYLLIHHIIPIWMFFGFLTILIFCILLKIEKEDIVKTFKDEVTLKEFIYSVIMGPIGVFILLKDYWELCRDERELLRQECGWWELKEYGGKH